MYDDNTSPDPTTSLFKALGQEVGLRTLVDGMLEQTRVDNHVLFGKIQGNEIKLDDAQLVTKYSLYLSSLLDHQY